MAQTQTASLTLAEMLVLIRAHLVDSDTSNLQFTDAQYTDDLNDEYALWYQENNDRSANLTGADTFGAISSATVAGLSATSTNANITEWQRLFIDPFNESGSSFAVGPELEIMDVGSVKQLQDDDATPGVPKVAAVYKLQNSVPASIGRWGLFLWPIPDVSYYISALATVSPYKLDGTVTTDRFDVTEAESRMIVARRAYRVASRQGRDESMLNAIASSLPQDQQALLGRKTSAESSKV
jgi:hypothetical protein